MNYEKPFVGDVNLAFLSFTSEQGKLVCSQPGWATGMMGIMALMLGLSPLVAYAALGPFGSGMINHFVEMFQSAKGASKYVFGGIAFFIAIFWLHSVLYCLDKVIRNPRIEVDADGAIHLYKG